MALETLFSVFVKNRVGMLNELCTAISEANINIRGFSTVVEADWAIVSLIVDDANKTKEVLHKQNLKFGESTVLTVGMDNKPGQIAKITKKLSEQHINIDHATLTAEGEHCLLVLMTTDNRKANEILG
jgi:hypothetical protein